MASETPLQEPQSTPSLENDTPLENSNGQQEQTPNTSSTLGIESAEVDGIVPLFTLAGTDGSVPEEVKEPESEPASVTALISSEELFQLWPYVGMDIVIPQKPPTWVQAFLGSMFDVRQQLKDVLEMVQGQIAEIKNVDGVLSPMQMEQLEQRTQHRQRLLQALETYQWTTAKIWLYQWSMVLLVAVMTVIEAVVVVVYARWHGVNLLSADFYSAAQVSILSNMNFVNGPVTMSIIAEILTWSSLGVWASYSYQYGRLMVERKFRFAEHGPMYIAHLTRNTSVVAAVILLLRLSQFSIFGISIADNSPLGFDSTIGLAFLLGFFGDDATRLLLGIKNLIMGQVEKGHEGASAVG